MLWLIGRCSPDHRLDVLKPKQDGSYPRADKAAEDDRLIALNKPASSQVTDVLGMELTGCQRKIIIPG